VLSPFGPHGRFRSPPRHLLRKFGRPAPGTAAERVRGPRLRRKRRCGAPRQPHWSTLAATGAGGPIVGRRSGGRL